MLDSPFDLEARCSCEWHGDDALRLPVIVERRTDEKGRLIYELAVCKRCEKVVWELGASRLNLEEPAHA